MAEYCRESVCAAAARFAGKVDESVYRVADEADAALGAVKRDAATRDTARDAARSLSDLIADSVAAEAAARDARAAAAALGTAETRLAERCGALGAKEDAGATRLGAALADEAAARGAALTEHQRRVVAARRCGRGGERERCVAAGSGQCGAAVSPRRGSAQKSGMSSRSASARAPRRASSGAAVSVERAQYPATCPLKRAADAVR